MHKRDILEIISQNDLSFVLEKLNDTLIHGKSYVDLVHYQARYRELKAYGNKGILSNQELLTETNKFRAGLVQFIEDLDDREFIGQILLLSPDGPSHQQLAESFKRYFPNTAENFSGEYWHGDYALVVVNDLFTAPEKQEAFEALVQQYLDHKFFMVYATKDNQKGLVNRNRDKIHAANSTFSLYARVREMIDFVRYFAPNLR